MQKSNTTVKTEKTNVSVNNCNTTEVCMESKTEELRESPRTNQDKYHETNTSTNVDEKAQSIECETCQKCNQRFSNPSDLKFHMKTHAAEKPFKCHKCEQAYSRKNLFHNHMLSHDSEDCEKIVTCEICNQNFTGKQNLVQHIETAHSIGKNVEIEALYSCKVCNEKFQRKSHLIVHRKTHSLRTYVCHICNRSFKYEGSYTIHMDAHSVTKPVIFNICNICHYEFRSYTALLNHMRLHTGEKPFACDKCNKKFAFKVALVKHYCIDGNQPYKRKVIATETPKVCNKCHAQFKSEVTLASHMRMHAGHKPFKCNMCEKQFAFKVALVTHVCINGKKPYMIKTENNRVEKFREPIDNIETVKVERLESETEKEVQDRIEIKIERDELESEDIGIAEIKIEAIRTEIKEEY